MIVRHLQELDEGDRIVRAATWLSRRLVLSRDKTGFSFHDTIVKGGSSTKQWHSEHDESVYCVEGSGKLRVNGKEWKIEPGTIYIPDQREAHILQADTDMRLMCVMSPPLAGSEVQDETGSFPLLAKPRALRRKNIFVIGLDSFNRYGLETIRNAENYDYEPLLSPGEVLERDDYDIDELVSKAESIMNSFDGRVDGLVHYIDFPVSTIVPILSQRVGLPSASLESVLKCEHKYWSRIEQARCIPQHVPPFRAFDPFDDHALDELGMAFPFWIKPIKSFSSYLGFKIHSREEWNDAINEIRANIRRFRAFDKLLERVDLPEEVVGIGAGHCIAEAIIAGHQCTQEGFVHKGEVSVYGTVDSLRAAGISSFTRYQYPSRLPVNVRKRMTKISEAYMKHIRYDNAPFNIEYFWDANEDKIWFLEANTRISESHTDLFHKVDGASHHEIAVDLSLGERPRLPYRDGEYACAGKFFVRRYGPDARVTRVPTTEEIAALQQKFPGTQVKIVAEEGKLLSELYDQDSYSFVLAILWLGASSPRQLDKRYEQVLDLLPFEFSSVDAAE